MITLLLGLSILPLMAIDLAAYDTTTDLPEKYEEDYSITITNPAYNQDVYEFPYSYNQAIDNGEIIVVIENIDTGSQYSIVENGTQGDIFLADFRTDLDATNDILEIIEPVSTPPVITWNDDGTWQAVDTGTSVEYGNFLDGSDMKISVYVERATIVETIFGTISAVVIGGISVVAFLFSNDGIINVFYTPATETVSGSLTMIGVLSLLTFGFGLVVFAFRKILKLLKMRS